jgi:hypothetical protein
MRPVQPSVVAVQRHVMLSAVSSSGIVNSMIRIAGIGDRDRPEWLIRISGMRTAPRRRRPGHDRARPKRQPREDGILRLGPPGRLFRGGSKWTEEITSRYPPLGRRRRWDVLRSSAASALIATDSPAGSPNRATIYRRDVAPTNRGSAYRRKRPIEGVGISGWDSERKQWRQLWAGKDLDRDGLHGRSGGGRDVRPHVRAQRRWDSVAVHVPEYPTRQCRRRICLAWRRRRILDRGVVGSLRSDRTAGFADPGTRPS